MGTLSRSWDLIRQTFAVLKSDEELMWLPVLSALFGLAATVIIFGTGLVLMTPPGPIPHDPAQLKELFRAMTPFIFLFYVVIYSITIYFNVALVSIAANRLAGGQATLNDGLQLAWKRKWSILQWALLAATVGILLEMLERRLGFVGRLLTRFTGIIWTLASVFVAPLLAAQDMGPVEALTKSAQIFRRTWGEQVVAGIGFGPVFVLLYFPGLYLPFLGARFGPSGLLIGFAFAAVYCLILGVINSALRGIFIAALYRYATDGQVSPGFHLDDLSGAWQPKEG
jgi:hypothetical protein